MPGFINSSIQIKILNFIERVGPYPTQALEIIFGRKTQKHLFSLRRAGYIYNISLSGIEFWSPQGYGHFDIQKQETITWLVARTIESGGNFINNVVISPTGVELAAHIKKDRVILTDTRNRRYIIYTNDLKNNILKNCITVEK